MLKVFDGFVRMTKQSVKLFFLFRKEKIDLESKQNMKNIKIILFTIEILNKS